MLLKTGTKEIMKRGRNPFANIIKRNYDTRIRLVSMRSSFLTGKAVAVSLLAGGAASFAMHRTQPGIVLIFFGAAALLSRKMALDSLRDVEFEAEGSRYAMFPDSDFELILKINNHKALPLIWLEAAFPVEEDSPVRPVNEEDIFRSDGLTRADEDLPDCPMLRIKTAFIMPYQELEIKVPMKAVRRGIFSFDMIRLYSGDGLGLAQAGMTAAAPGRSFAVFPRPADVSTELFTRNQWMSKGGSRGCTEDPTLIRGTREYQTGDQWKRINWRMTARGLPLTVNLPEMILPASSHFIVDGESFGGTEPLREEFEQMLGILSGIILRLDEMGLSCGLTLPDSLRGRGQTLDAGTDPAGLLYALAEYELKMPVYDENNEYIPSASFFNKRRLMRSISSSGAVYYFTENASAADKEIIRMAEGRIVLITSRQPSEKEIRSSGCRIVPFSAILRKK